MAPGYLSEMFVSFQGEGSQVGRRQLFVRLTGCNLRCRYCDTPDSLERGPGYVIHQQGGVVRGENPLTATAAVQAALELLGGEQVDGMSITGGEPLLQSEFLAELLADDRLPRPRLLETNGMLPNRLRQVVSLLDIISMDIKLPSNSGEPGFWDAHARFLEIAAGKAYVKVLVDRNTDPGEVERAASLVKNTAPATPLFVQPITDPDGACALPISSLQVFFAASRRHLSDVRVLPQTHKMLEIQ
jgi:organic radical activating enzyme